MESQIRVVVRIGAKAVARYITKRRGVSITSKRWVIVAGVVATSREIAIQPTAFGDTVDVACWKRGDLSAFERRTRYVLGAQIDQISAEQLANRRTTTSIEKRCGGAARGT